MEIEEYFVTERKKFNDALEYFLTPLKENSMLYAAISYALLSPGKRLRPILLIATYECNGGKSEDALPFAVGIEMIHTYSLIHDDLPIMDNSDMRRGRPTCHKIYGSDMALLAGDALLTFAFEIISSQRLLKLFGEDILIRVVHEFAQAAGFKGMVGGQVMDMITLSSENVSEETIIYIEKMKTAALITLPLKVGGILSKVDDSEVKALSRFGEFLGISYQILDDILDETSTVEELGKDVRQDIKNKKASFVYLQGVEKAREIATEYKNKAIDFLKPYNEKYSLLIAIADYIGNRVK